MRKRRSGRSIAIETKTEQGLIADNFNDTRTRHLADDSWVFCSFTGNATEDARVKRTRCENTVELGCNGVAFGFCWCSNEITIEFYFACKLVFCSCCWECCHKGKHGSDLHKGAGLGKNVCVDG